MAIRLSNNKAREHLMNEIALRSVAKLPDAICTTGHASQLLDELRKSYQALTLEERKEVAAFISELSHGEPVAMFSCDSVQDKMEN